MNGCDRFVFAHNRCIYCYRREIQYPKQQAKEKKYYRIPPVSEKRKLLNKTYERKKEEKWQELIENKQNYCYFTNKLISARESIPDFHHSLGRDGDLLCDKEHMFPCYSWPHREYHDMKYEYKDLIKIAWYFDWINRIKTISPIVYHKELYKIERANNGKIPKEITV